MKSLWKFGWIALLVIAADQVTKRLALSLKAPVTLIPGVLGLRQTRNTGVAFSLLSGTPWLVILLSAAILAGGGLLLRRYRLGALTRTGAMLIAGGALSNMISRIAAQGWRGVPRGVDPQTDVPPKPEPAADPFDWGITL